MADFVVTSGRAQRVSGEFDYLVEAGTDTIYYGDSETVSSSSNIGSVAAGSSLTRRSPSWVVSAGTSYLRQNPPAGREVDPNSVQTEDIQDSAVTTAKVADSAITAVKIGSREVTIGKLDNITTDSLLGRDTAASGGVEVITLNSSLSMDGSQNLQRAALSGDISAPAGSNTTAIGSSKVTSAMIVDGTVADGDLASPNNVAYKVLTSQPFLVAQSTTAATYWAVSTGTLTASGTAGNAVPDYLTGADYTVAGKTTKLRISAAAYCNATDSTITVTPGLYPVTVAGASNTIAPTLGTVVSGSTAALACSGVTSNVVIANSGDFTIPADGMYMPGLVVPGTSAANSRIHVKVVVQIRHV